MCNKINLSIIMLRKILLKTCRVQKIIIFYCNKNNSNNSTEKDYIKNLSLRQIYISFWNLRAVKIRIIIYFNKEISLKIS